MECKRIMSPRLERPLTPLVSIILPCYNGSNYVKEAIESVVKQSYSNWELIIINDGSTDNSERILKSICASDVRMKYYAQKNIGLARTLNKGIDLSAGQFIARIDCDDIWSNSDKLRRQVDLLLRDQDTILVGTSINLINEFGTVQRAIPIHCFNSLDATEKLVSRKKFFAHSTIMFKKEFKNRRIKYRTNIKLAEDYDLYLRLSKIGDIKSIKEVYTDIRMFEGKLTSGVGAWQSNLDVIAAIKSHYTEDTVENQSVDDESKDLRKRLEEDMDKRTYNIYAQLMLGNIGKKLSIALIHPYVTLQYIFFRKLLIKKIIKL